MTSDNEHGAAPPSAIGHAASTGRTSVAHGEGVRAPDAGPHSIAAGAGPRATVYDIEQAGQNEIDGASYAEIAQFVAEHPRRIYLRIEGEGFPEPVTAENFMDEHGAKVIDEL